MNNHQVAILIPAWNEEKVIGQTLKSLLKIVPSEDIFVVVNGSSDTSAQIARQYTSNVLSLSKSGKARAINTAIAEFKLTDRYPYIMPLEAETIITENIFDKVLPIFEADTEEKIACVACKVVGDDFKPVTAYRLWEYEVSQTIHKMAQAKEDAIIVCPGCSTIYRSKILKQVEIPTGTLTEDMDLTFLIHRKNLGRILFTDKAIVKTQDPQTLKDLIRQINRWYTGFWQCLIKHNIPWGGQALDGEVALLATEGLFNGFLVLAMILLFPLALLKNPMIVVIPIGIDFFFFLLPTMVLTALRQKAWKIFLYLPHFYFIRVLTSFFFLINFFRVILGKDLNMRWSKAQRYEIVQETI